ILVSRNASTTRPAKLLAWLVMDEGGKVKEPLAEVTAPGATSMSTPTTQPRQATTKRRQLLLYVLIASLPFSDFLQAGIVAFNAAPVMGDLAASPEEYSLVATLYAVVAIGMISMHRWLVERLGWW